MCLSNLNFNVKYLQGIEYGIGIGGQTTNCAVYQYWGQI